MERCVKQELLGDMPPDDPRAVWSRGDLLRANAWMGHRGIMARVLRSTCPGPGPRHLVDLGTGDGRFLQGVARRLRPDWQGTNVVLLDRQNVVSPATCQGFAALGWRATPLQADTLEWVRQQDTPACDAIIANLSLHHFTEAQLADLLRGAARVARVFIAIEPRRAARCLFFTRMIWLIGCNEVTRHDAPISVHAGFTGQEMSRLWPAGQGWSLTERRAGFFSHLFIAQRKG
jgi:hypothetical protein